jgi:hypothetical protein
VSEEQIESTSPEIATCGQSASTKTTISHGILKNPFLQYNAPLLMELRSAYFELLQDDSEFLHQHLIDREAAFADRAVGQSSAC